jgi:1,2-phenylacetyl-CoA epoxidase PaaB subunit
MRNGLHTCNDEYAPRKPGVRLWVCKLIRAAPETRGNSGSENWHAGCICIG